MKYFTIEWWAGEVEDDSHLFDDYRAHIEHIFADLPPDHQRLTNEVSLHDARLLRFTADFDKRTLMLDLDGCGFDQSSNSYFGRRFELQYSEVDCIETTANPEKGLPGPHGYGDLGYYEIDLISPGLFEHRLLFSTGIVLTVRHRRFTLTYVDHPYPNAEQAVAPNDR